MNESNLGWFYIDEVWNLFIDGELSQVHVDFIQVCETPDEDQYLVRHFARNGDMVRLKLDQDDIEPEVTDREPTDRPSHI